MGPLRALVVVLALFFAAAQLFVLPPEGWVTGDQGSKYLQTRAFAAHGPLNPGIEVLSRDIDPEYRYQEPKMKNRRGRLVSEFLWLLPLITAPFYRLFGLRGLYVLPALSVIAIAVFAAALARRLAGDRGAWLAWIAVCATPVIVYGLEFWEHAPAVALVMAAATLAYRDDPNGPRASMRLFGAGAAVAAGALFREEVIVALPALILARAAVSSAHPVKTTMIDGAWAAAGAAAVFAAAVPMNLSIYGAPLPMHMTQDAWDVAMAVPYLQVRRDIIWAVMLPANGIAVYVAAVAVGLAAAVLQWWRQRRNLASPRDATGRALLGVVHAAAGVMVALAAVLPLWRMVVVGAPGDPYRITSAAHTWIFAIALLYWPWIADAVDRRAARYLLISGLLIVAMTYVLVPTDGGSQWSPRFFLAAAPLLALVAGAALIRVPAAALILLASMAIQVTGAGWVKHSKTFHSQLTAWVAGTTAPGDVLISDVYWFPELTASLAPTRRMLFSWRPGEMPAMAAVAVKAGYRHFRFVTSPQLTGFEPPQVIQRPEASCRLVESVERPPLLVSGYSCAPVP